MRSVLSTMVWALTAISLSAGLAAAQDEPEGSSRGAGTVYLGALLGFSIPDHDNSSLRLAYGFTGGAKLKAEWGLGGYVFSASQTASTAPAGQPANSTTLRDTAFGIEANYFSNQLLPGLHLGPRIGLIAVSGTRVVDNAVREGGRIEFAPGFQVGYDHPLDLSLTAGGEYNMMFVTGNPAYKLHNILGTLKFWF